MIGFIIIITVDEDITTSIICSLDYLHFSMFHIFTWFVNGAAFVIDLKYMH